MWCWFPLSSSLVTCRETSSKHRQVSRRWCLKLVFSQRWGGGMKNYNRVWMNVCARVDSKHLLDDNPLWHGSSGLCCGAVSEGLSSAGRRSRHWGDTPWPSFLLKPFLAPRWPIPRRFIRESLGGFSCGHLKAVSAIGCARSCHLWF